MTNQHDKLAGLLDQIGGLVQQAADSVRGLSTGLPDDEASAPAPKPEPGAAPTPPVTGTPNTSHLPILELDVQKSAEQGKIITKGEQYNRLETGVIIQVPENADVIPIGPVELRYDHNSPIKGDTAAVVLRGTKDNRPTFLNDTGKGGGIGLFANNHVKPRLTFILQDIDVDTRSTTSASAIGARHLADFVLRRMKIQGGKNGIFSAHQPSTFLFDEIDVSLSGNGGGKTHCCYLNYADKVTVRNSRFHAANGLGHAFKCYARVRDIRNSTFASYLSQEDADNGFTGQLPPVDLGAFGTTVFARNLVRRVGPDARISFAEIRNRRYPEEDLIAPEGWGTDEDEVDYRDVDNRDIDNPHLLHHVFSDNVWQNDVDGGFLVWNHGTAPWDREVRGSDIVRSVPADWAYHNERAVVWLHDNTIVGNALDSIANPVPFKQPGLKTPIREVDELPDLITQMVENGIT